MGISLWQILIIVCILAVTAFVLWLEVQIVHKAGYSGWWVLTTFVPLVNIVMIYIFAFSQWPNEKDGESA